MRRIPRKGTYFGTLPTDLDKPLALFEGSCDYRVKLNVVGGRLPAVTLDIQGCGISWGAQFALMYVRQSRDAIEDFIQDIEEGRDAALNLAQIRFVYIERTQDVALLERTGGGGIGYTANPTRVRMCDDLLNAFRRMASV